VSKHLFSFTPQNSYFPMFTCLAVLLLTWNETCFCAPLLYCLTRVIFILSSKCVFFIVNFSACLEWQWISQNHSDSVILPTHRQSKHTLKCGILCYAIFSTVWSNQFC
jgi:hypothetical protein